MKTKPMRTIDEIKSDIDAARKRVDDIDKRIGEICLELSALNEERYSLFGCYRTPGKLGELRRELAKAEQFVEDGRLPTVVWATDRPYDCVVDKVTSKRIYVRERGYAPDERFRNHEIYRLDGTPESQWRSGVIDIRNTFGIDADVLPPKWKMEKPVGSDA